MQNTGHQDDRLNLSPKSVAVLFSVAFATAAAAFSSRAQMQGQAQNQVQSQSQVQSRTPPSSTTTTSNLILLDPAHGGTDSGATLDGNVLEKDLTLALAGRLRSALTSAGFKVLATRDADPSDPLTTDERAGIANRGHALACIVLHASSTGSGVHVYTSMLAPLPADDQAPSSFIPIPWQTAQAGFVSQSQSLAATLTAAFAKGNLAAFDSAAPLRPLDNLMCPAIAIEIAPLRLVPSSPTPATDPAYQQQVATLLTSALRTWRAQAMPATAEDSSPSTPRRQPLPAATGGQSLPRAIVDLDRQIAAQSRSIAGAGHTNSPVSKPPPKGPQ